jgi:hypothetical protein
MPAKPPFLQGRIENTPLGRGEHEIAFLDAGG